MSRRTLSLAAVALWMSAAVPAAAQNLEAGKSPSQIFAATCALCHKSAHGLLKSVAPGSLPGFLRQHYTTSVEMAGAMSAYVLSNGAANRRPGDDLTREGRESRSLPKPREPETVRERPEPREEHHVGGEKPMRGHVTKPKEEGSAERSGEPEAKGKKPKADRRKPKNVPAKDEPKDTSRPNSDTSPQPAEAPTSESAKPVAPDSAPSKPADAPVKPDDSKPASSNMPVFNIEPKPDAKPEAKPEQAPPASPSPEKPATPPAGSPAAPISQ